MTKTLLITAFITSIASTSAFAHHPAADRVDPEIYSMIDANVADTPHADLSFDDMGRDMEEVGAAMDANEELARMNDETSMDVDMDTVMDTDPAIDTMTMLENIDTQVID